MFRSLLLRSSAFPRASLVSSKQALYALRPFSASSIISNQIDFEGIAKSSLKDIVNVNNPQANSNAVSEVIHKYILYCNFTKNNTHLTLTAVTEDLNYIKKNPSLSYNEKVLYYYHLPQKVKLTLSTGQLGFRKSARGEYEAAFQTATKAFALMQEKKYLNKPLDIVVKNFGKGREAFVDALKGKEGDFVRPKVVRLSDNTKLKFGGTRSPKARRL